MKKKRNQIVHKSGIHCMSCGKNSKYLYRHDELCYECYVAWGDMVAEESIAMYD